MVLGLLVLFSRFRSALLCERCPEKGDSDDDGDGNESGSEWPEIRPCKGSSENSVVEQRNSDDQDPQERQISFSRFHCSCPNAVHQAQNGTRSRGPFCSSACSC